MLLPMCFVGNKCWLFCLFLSHSYFNHLVVKLNDCNNIIFVYKIAKVKLVFNMVITVTAIMWSTLNIWRVNAFRYNIMVLILIPWYFCNVCSTDQTFVPMEIQFYSALSISKKSSLLTIYLPSDISSIFFKFLSVNFY